MNDDVKKAADAALVESMVQQLRDCVSVGDEMTLDHASLLDDAADWIAGEPERLAAAVAAAREEQREADVRSCPTCKGEGFTMRVRECPFCNDSTHDHECPTDEVKVYCACGAAHIRATPLTATPLKDRIVELERERDSWKATATMHESLRAETLKANLNLAAERDAALARAKELEGLLVQDREHVEMMSRERREAIQRAEKAEAERDALKAQLAEAVEVLRGLMAALSADPQSELDAMTIHDFDSMADYTRAHNELTHEIAARAFLAKVKGFV